jgi:phosphoglucomutase
MPTHPLAGKPPPPELLIDVAALERDYYQRMPDLSRPEQRVSFGTSGHRGTPLSGSFNEAHILAVTQAVCDYRRSKGIDGPLFLGKDTHAADQPAARTALEVLAANAVETVLASNDGFTPTPVISHAILAHNRRRATGLADGIIITPSHNPPRDGGIKYNPPHGGPADVDITRWIQDRANALMTERNSAVKRVPYEQALRASTTHARDLVTPYVDDLGHVVDFDIIRSAGLRIGADPLGGASAQYWQPIWSAAARLAVTTGGRPATPARSRGPAARRAPPSAWTAAWPPPRRPARRGAPAPPPRATARAGPWGSARA